MFTEERRKAILDLLARKGRAQSQDLALKLKVSEDTIRRDLKELAEVGLLKKVHGGAMALSTVPFDHTIRKELNIEEKSRLAAKAATLLKPGMVVFVDGGSTTGLLSEKLPSNLSVTFITHSLANAVALSACKTSKVIVLGGSVVPELLINEGSEVISQAQRFHADLAILSVQGLTDADGATVSHYQDALVKACFINCSSEVAVLAGTEKIGFTLPYKVCNVDEIDVLITAEGLDLSRHFTNKSMQILSV